MSDNNQRRARRVLAQRRPAPNRVQVRRRTRGPSTSWIRIDWAKASAVVAVVAALAGLLFTGISTFYGALVARDQLGQAREDARTRAEDQASKVTFWVEDRDLKRGHLLHVVNRSSDAITQVEVLIIANVWLLLPEEFGSGGDARYTFRLSGIGPCTEALFDFNHLYYRFGEDQQYQPMTTDWGARVQVRFIDRKAVVWNRDWDHLWTGKTAMPEPEDPVDVANDRSQPSMRPLDTCESN